MNRVPRPPRIERVDWFLQEFVKFANEAGVMTPVVLAIGGVLVSGTLVSGKDYFSGFAQEFAEGIRGGSDEVKEQWKALLVSYGDDVYGPHETEDVEVSEGEQPAEAESNATVSEPHYLHLMNARIFHPGGQPIPSNRGVWWRTRLEAVDGFCLGILGQDDENLPA